MVKFNVRDSQWFHVLYVKEIALCCYKITTDSKSSRHPELQFSVKYSVRSAIYVIKCSITSINCHTTA